MNAEYCIYVYIFQIYGNCFYFPVNFGLNNFLIIEKIPMP